jgi:Fe-S oxidoreductase/nitrate reductase gamma subunit
MTASPLMQNANTQSIKQNKNKILPVLRDFVMHVVFQVRILNKAYPGVMHTLLHLGFTLQVLGTIFKLMQMQLFTSSVGMPTTRSSLYLGFELVMDLAGAAILLGVILAAVRRFVLRPKSLETRWDDIFILVLLGLIPIFGFTLEALRLTIAQPGWVSWSPVGNLFARTFAGLGMSVEGAARWHRIFFYTHIATALVLIAAVPYTKLRHLAKTSLNVILRNRRREGTLAKIENLETAGMLGANTIADFSPSQLLSFDACVRCGRCEEVCPASQIGEPYSPQQMIQTLRAVMLEKNGSNKTKSDKPLLGQALDVNAPWYCTTCGACLFACPAFVNPVDEVIEFRRYLALTTGKVPTPVANTLRNIELRGNPWGMPPQERKLHLARLGVREINPGEVTQVLLFLGCAASLDERNRKASKALVQLLQAAGVDFAVMSGESCCGETARRLGQEYVFQVLAQRNVEALKQVNFDKIVTQCPHCYNVLKHEYPQFGGFFKVKHVAEFLMELTLPLDCEKFDGNGRVAYHDACYLGRYNGVYREPRDLLARAGVKTVEMSRMGENSFCCGGGGGRMWMESDGETRINQHRLNDALEAGAGTIATACPYCLLMFDDALRSRGMAERVKVSDVTEILAARLQV